MLRKHSLSQSELAKYWRTCRASKSEEKRKQWSKGRREREKHQRERELVEQEELAENWRQKQERKLTPQEEKRRRHAEAQARYRAKMKKPTNEVESSTPPSTPNSKAKEIMEAIEKSTPRIREINRVWCRKAEVQDGWKSYCGGSFNCGEKWQDSEEIVDTVTAKCQ